MVRAALPQIFIGNIQTNSNFPPEGEGITGGVIPADWFDTDWNCRVPITVNSGQVPSEQIDFPLLFNSTVIDFIADAQPNGEDFRFVLPDKIQLKYEIQSYDNSTGALIAWTKVPSIEDGTLVYLYFNNPTTTDNQDAPAVWSDYLNVLHMNQDPDGATQNPILDSTGNGNNAIPSASGVTQDPNTKIGKGLIFDGSTGVLNGNFPVNPSITVTIWAKSTNATGFWSDFGFMYSARVSNGFILHPNSNTSGPFAKTVSMFVFPDIGGFVPLGEVIPVDDNIEVYHRYGFVYDFQNKKAFVIMDDLLSTASNPNPDVARLDDPDVAIQIGKNGTSFGKMSAIEARIHSGVVTADLIITEFNNQNAPETFYDRGSVFCLGPVVDPLMIYTNGIQMTYKPSGLKMQYQ